MHMCVFANYGSCSGQHKLFMYIYYYIYMYIYLTTVWNGATLGPLFYRQWGIVVRKRRLLRCERLRLEV